MSKTPLQDVLTQKTFLIAYKTIILLAVDKTFGVKPTAVKQ